MYSYRLCHVVLLAAFVVLNVMGPVHLSAYADGELDLPVPGTMVNLSPAYKPVIIRGITVHKDNPFLFDFIVDAGQDHLSGEPLKKEGEKLIKYFLASLALPDKDVWVNLSPYEKNKIIPDALGQTDMGRDLLEQDYILKQITASLIYPEKQLGKIFWDRVYAKSQAMYGTTDIPVNTFNKVWITADRAEVFEHSQTAFVVDQHLKVMLEEDYLSLQKHTSSSDIMAKSEMTAPSHSITSQIIKQIILPELEKEINTGKNFANLRQIFNSIILSSWYKKNLQHALLNQVYADKSQVNGVIASGAKQSQQQIYEQYLKAYKKGVFNYIKEDIFKGEPTPRKYFSGGLFKLGIDPKITFDEGTLARLFSVNDKNLFDFATIASPYRIPADNKAMIGPDVQRLHPKALARFRVNIFANAAMNTQPIGKLSKRSINLINYVKSIENTGFFTIESALTGKKIKELKIGLKISDLIDILNITSPDYLNPRLVALSLLPQRDGIQKHGEAWKQLVHHAYRNQSAGYVENDEHIRLYSLQAMLKIDFIKSLPYLLMSTDPNREPAKSIRSKVIELIQQNIFRIKSMLDRQEKRALLQQIIGAMANALIFERTNEKAITLKEAAESILAGINNQGEASGHVSALGETLLALHDIGVGSPSTMTMDILASFQNGKLELDDIRFEAKVRAYLRDNPPLKLERLIEVLGMKRSRCADARRAVVVMLRERHDLYEHLEDDEQRIVRGILIQHIYRDNNNSQHIKGVEESDKVRWQVLRTFSDLDLLESLPYLIASLSLNNEPEANVRQKVLWLIKEKITPIKDLPEAIDLKESLESILTIDGHNDLDSKEINEVLSQLIVNSAMTSQSRQRPYKDSIFIIHFVKNLIPVQDMNPINYVEIKRTGSILKRRYEFKISDLTDVLSNPASPDNLYARLLALELLPQMPGIKEDQDAWNDLISHTYLNYFTGYQEEDESVRLNSLKAIAEIDFIKALPYLVVATDIKVEPVASTRSQMIALIKGNFKQKIQKVGNLDEKRLLLGHIIFAMSEILALRPYEKEAASLMQTAQSARDGIDHYQAFMYRKASATQGSSLGSSGGRTRISQMARDIVNSFSNKKIALSDREFEKEVEEFLSSNPPLTKDHLNEVLELQGPLYSSARRAAAIILSKLFPDDAMATGHNNKNVSAAMKSQVAHVVDRASLAENPGGIDLNTTNGMQWKISKDGKGVEMNINSAMIARIRNQGIESLSPVIVRMTPISSIWPLIGLENPNKKYLSV